MGQRGGVKDTGRDVWRCHVVQRGRVVAAEWVVPHSCVVGKNGEKYLGSK